MMGKRGLLAVIATFSVWGMLYPQEISHKVLVPAGSVINIGNIWLSQTVGESAIEILNADDYALTQGFQQPRMIPVDIPPPQGTNVNAYPSPVADILTIEFYGSEPRSFKLYMVNVFGAEIFRKELNFTGPYWYKLYQPVSDLSSGLYLLRVESNDKVVKKTIKIEKL